MKGIKTIFFLLFVHHLVLNATHNRAGEITFRQLSDLTYEIVITTFTYTLSPADREELEVLWGDNTSSMAVRSPRERSRTEKLPGFYQLNKYYATHTYPGPGTYEIIVQDPNRNFGVMNIPNSVNVIFSISTTLIINANVGRNNTPVLLNPPIDKAAKGHVFIHNPAAFDEDGDSISYKLTICRGEGGEPIENYTFPKSSNKPIYIDSITGNLIWDSPVDTGIYNIAIDVEEWRDGLKIGNIVRDMQVDVHITDNTPPVNDDLTDYCIIAGDSIEFEFTSIDIDNDSVFHELNGGPFTLNNPPEYYPVNYDYGYTTSKFKWVTTCKNVRKQPYNIIVKSQDVNDNLQLVDIDNFFIRVIGAPPKNLQTSASNNSITLTWDPVLCGRIAGYDIYRKMDPGNFTPDSCEYGIPAYTGYEKIAEVKGKENTEYVDTNEDIGLAQGIKYCYRIVAIYEDGAESIASEESCAILVPGLPAMSNVSVTNADINGSIFLSWIKPDIPDSIASEGPFEYLIYRSPDLKGNNPELIETINTTNLSDTTYTDTGINTLEEYPYSYIVELYYNEPGNRFLIGNPETASSFYPHISAGDNSLTLNFMKDVPWLNTSYTIYRYNMNSDTFDSLDTTGDNQYVDSGLKNGKEYCYYATSEGWRMVDSVIYTIENISHRNCGTPVDNEPPCPPVLDVHTNCDSLENKLTWTNPNNYCANDVMKYKVFYTNQIESELVLIATINNPEDTILFHKPSYGPAGCYAVSAIDSFENESKRSVVVCVDECSGYDLPNVFTPNNDGYNDIYKSINPGNYVKRVEMKIFNRWGNVVYETEDPNINWDGRSMENNQPVSSGVYYYICDVYEPRLIGVVVNNMVGFIHVYTENAEDTLIE